ncbi:agenet domain-containing protein [Forsythia ovata]|uniref:Agenet domain-containing protein n=1 Tax=Forsythia ovata TaxID=205694 RepID=A0ABD1SMZ7_9LAMI
MADNVDADPFKNGTQVEVSLEDDNFWGPWYTATVIRPHFQEDPQNSSRVSHTHVREAVDPILVHPIPPHEARWQFNVREDVDAFHNDDWWEGIVITDLDGGRYSVFFRSSRKQIEFDESQLRLHREWVYGKWTKMWNFCLPFSIAFFGEL